ALPALRQAALVVGRGEEPLAVDAWTDDVGAYTPLALDRLAGPDDNLAAELAAICAERGLTGGAMGYEGSFDLLGVPHWQGEVRIPSEASLAALPHAAGGRLPRRHQRTARGAHGEERTGTGRAAARERGGGARAGRREGGDPPRGDGDGRGAGGGVGHLP